MEEQQRRLMRKKPTQALSNNPNMLLFLLENGPLRTGSTMS
jgi:hypothetical protein